MPKAPEWRPPQFCDFDCCYAAFAPPDASGACRREQAVWCTLQKQHNNKNARCLVRSAVPKNEQKGASGRGRLRKSG